MTMPGGFILDELAIRSAIADAGQAAVGLGSTGPLERQQRYEAWLFPHDEPRAAAQMADAMYSCGLNALACLRASGVDAPELAEPYQPHAGAVVAWLGNIARRMGAYVDLSTPAAVAKAPPLRYGDVLVVDGPVHVIVLTGEDPGGFTVSGDTFSTSEGGSPEYGRTRDGKGMEKGMGIKTRVMRTRVFGGRLQTGTVNADGSVTWGRLALYAINARWLCTGDGLLA
jgi:hypothetical protein